MAQLNEDVLRLIFDNLETPLDWINVSEVCRLWKSAASKHWRKINVINYGVQIPFGPEITAEDAERIVKCAAPFVQKLEHESTLFKNQQIHFGPFSYKVIDFNPDKVLELLAEHAEKLTEVNLYEAPERKLLQSLINGKKINTFKFKYCNNFYEQVSTDDIEQLNLQFDHFEIVRPFKGHFPNLKKLILKVKVDYLSSILEPILPYVLGLKTINIEFIPSRFPSSELSVSCKTLMGLTKLLQLEEITLTFRDISYFTDVGSFIKKLAKNCPKLRMVYFVGMQITGKQICSLLSLPHLDQLYLLDVLKFRSIELSKMSNLTKLSMVYERATFDITIFCNFLRKMPKLKLLQLLARPYNEQFEFELVCQVIVAVSRNKDVLVLSNRMCFNGFDKWKIARNNAESFETTTLNIQFCFVAENFSNDIQNFVRNNLEGYTVEITR